MNHYCLESQLLPAKTRRVYTRSGAVSSETAIQDFCETGDQGAEPDFWAGLTGFTGW